jgi:hypothetical protein
VRWVCVCVESCWWWWWWWWWVVNFWHPWKCRSHAPRGSLSER